MVSKSKKIVALLLTAMMAATAFAGCGGGETTTSSTAPAASTASTSGDTSASGDASQTQASTTAEAVDLDSADMLQKIKDQIAQEAAATENVVSMTVWCSGDDFQFEKTLVKEFEEKYADSRYTFKIKVNGSIGEDSAGGKITESPKDGADVFSFADDQLSKLVEAKAIAPVGAIFQNNVIASNTADSVAVCSMDGVPYAFPKTSDNGYFLYYDKRIFPTEADVASLDDMITKAAAANKNVYLNISNAWYNTGFYFSAGVDITYQNGLQKANFDSEEGLKAAKAMCHVAESQGKGFEGTAGTMGDNAAVQQGFAEGTLAAAVIGTWVGPAIKQAIGNDNVGAAKLPTVLMGDEQVQLHSFGGYKVIGANAFSKYTVTAQTLAYFLSNPDSQLKRYQERGLIPTSNQALNSTYKDANGNDVVVKDDPALQAIEAQAPFAHAQGQSVGGKYWASNVAGFGGEIVTAKGKISDDKLKESLKNLQAQMD